jgi:hypothetical protein
MAYSCGSPLLGHDELPRESDCVISMPVWPAAIGIALLSGTETNAAGRAFAQSGEPMPRAT